jgi:hypothetical protein
MNRELVDYYETNNYDLSSETANQNILQTVVNEYPLLHETAHEIKTKRKSKTAWVSCTF